jgi:hypothetical protein
MSKTNSTKYPATEMDLNEAAMRDAHAALRNAMANNAWLDVAKYATQIQECRAIRARHDGVIYTFEGPEGATLRTSEGSVATASAARLQAIYLGQAK